VARSGEVVDAVGVAANRRFPPASGFRDSDSASGVRISRRAHAALVGLIGLFGIAVQNGLVLIAQVKALMADGAPFDAALREASIGRVRPKLMTACTAILGLLPLLVLRLHGTEIERPLAVVIGGLVTSTLFTLFALPTFYALVHRWQER
jgi:cobalt-zinc-cadmium resistance protein CzcA